jgi:hypothetical protein
MIRWALVRKSDGKIVKSGGSSASRAVLLPDLEDVDFDMFMDVPEHVRSDTHMFDYATQSWALRPTLPAPSASYDLTQLPAGTVLRVHDESGQIHEISDLSETLTLIGPQTYRITAESPFPFQRLKADIEVS